MMPLSVGKPFSNVGQLLEHDHIAAIFNGFGDDVVSDRMDVLVLFPPYSLSLPNWDKAL
jgi:hypothetical protein